MIIRFGEIESDQPALNGRVETDIFQLENDGVICSSGPIDFDLRTSAGDGQLIVEGTLSTPFQLRCVGCLEEFPYRCEINDYHAEMEIDDDSGTLDLTDHIRDDILLAIPDYPRCTGGEQPRVACPMDGPFSFESTSGKPPSAGLGKQQAPNVWDALENLDTGDH